MLPTLNYDAILSDPLLILAGLFLVVGPLVFLVSLIKLISWNRQQKRDAEFGELNPFSPLPVTPEETPLPPSAASEPFPMPSPAAPIEPEFQPETQASVPAMDKTAIVLPDTGEIQGQLEIAFTQIKTLSKKVSQMESELDSVARAIMAKLDKNELKEIPMNPADFTQKLLKLAEHVIVLEKEVDRLKTGAPKNDLVEAAPASERPTAAPATPKSPMMPL
jgi:hypothetical protein